MAIGSVGLSALVGCVGSLVAMPLQPPAEVTLSVIGDAPDDRLETFLVDRIQATWPLAPSQGASEIAEIVVRLEWGQQTVDVAIVRGSETLARRTLVYHGDGSTLAAAWLLIRGTIHRQLSEQPAPGEEAPPAQESRAAVSQEAPPTPPPVVVEKEQPAPAPARRMGDWELVALAQLGVEQARLIGVGGAVEASVGLGPQSEAAISGGYRYTPGGDALTIHTIPVRVLAGWRVGVPTSVLLGASAAVELKLARGETRKTVVSATLGPYAGIAIPAREELTWLIRFHFDVRIVRQTYVVPGDEIAEQPLAATLLTGLSWN